MAEVLSGAKMFRVERKGPFEVVHNPSGKGWLVALRSSEVGCVTWLHQDGFAVNGFETKNQDWGVWDMVCEGLFFPTEAEATYRMLLYQNPREALQPFFEATGGEYRGTCGECLAVGIATVNQFGVLVSRESLSAVREVICPTCHGTGGPPDRDTLLVAADWMEEREMDLEARVLRDVAKGTDNGH